MSQSGKIVVNSIYLVFALGLSGCGSSQGTQESEVGVSSTPDSISERSSEENEGPPTTDKRSEELQEVALDELSISGLGDSGVEVEMDDLVEAWENVTGAACTADLFYVEKYDSERVRCDTSTVLGVYSSTTSVKRHLEASDEAFREPENQLAGVNWTANVDQELLEGLHRELGGVSVQLGY